ncbi:MAG: RsfS/YbeB/iojap family protein, partial [Nitrosomonadaceae bacterium]
MKLNKLVKTVVFALEEIKARDIKVLDVTNITIMFDRMIIASAVSTRQAKALANNVHEKVKAAGGM